MEIAKTTQQREESRPCGAKCEIWSRVVGYFRPISDWNRGKRQEFVERKMFRIDNAAVERIPSSQPGNSR